MDLKTKALLVIEGMLLAVEETEEDGFLGACYKFAHIGLGDCSAPHANWYKEMEETYQKLIDNGIIGATYPPHKLPRPRNPILLLKSK